MSDNVKFADAFNFYMYRGKQIIKPNDLIEKDITEIALPYKNGKTYTVEKYRDLLKKCIVKSDEKFIYLLLGIENQSDIHYAMPIRNMLYDALNYAEQVSDIAEKHKRENDKMSGPEFLSGITKIDKIIPVVTLVIYWGSSNWDAPKSLYEMFHNVDLNTAQFINDYHINLIVPNEITDFSMFKTELGKVLEFLNASDDLEKMRKIIEKNHETYLHMDVDSARMIETFSKTKLETEKYEEEEEINVCKAIDDMIKEAVQEKETQMRNMIQEAVEKKGTQMRNMIQEAVDEKENQIRNMLEEETKAKLIEKICKKIKKNKSLEVIADELEEDVNEIKSVYDEAMEYVLDTNAEVIYDKTIS